MASADQVGGDLWARREEFNAAYAEGSAIDLPTTATVISGKSRPFPIMWTDKFSRTRVAGHVGSSGLARAQVVEDDGTTGIGIELIGDCAMEPYLSRVVEVAGPG